ncbi:tetratricopeptide repeat protein [Streptomyces sp. C10-9-1]|uniref:tetratricopeptide repeat protein n=1 Tax=Streptomyces sp. C10-9-1 TaxID=1859285 RepID=UPI0021132ADD|nr:tetratricopeptide repeat protein [Streptomyces sp. C10-9-1]MCQ6553695.1 tetratricopeptide repeat protein [Streptomyces sp. C10-9-1]
MTVTDTGDAEAAGDGTAVTGFRGPAPGTGPESPDPVHLSRTGNVTVNDGGIGVSGYVHQLTVPPRPIREPAPWPHQVGVIPPAARSFQHRAETDRLHAAADVGTTVTTQLLTGMGGVGKTQLAADYARTAWNDTSPGGGLDVLVWVTASSRSSIVTGYAQAGVELCRADPDDVEQAARTFLAWLTPKSGAKPCRWLIILDDVADPDDLKGLWPPENHRGRTLVTTRRRDAALVARGRRTIEVGLFTKAEAMTYLTASLTGHDESADELTALADDLGRLPLALAQAAAYVIDSGRTAAAYRSLLADRTATLSDTVPDVLPDDQGLALDAAWSLSLDRADALKPHGLARPLLHLASLLDPNGIPHSVLSSTPALNHLSVHRTSRPSADTPPQEVTAQDAAAALRVLHRLSLIDHTPTNPHQTVRLHQLIQRATRDALTVRQHHQSARTAADALLAAWSGVEHHSALAQTLRTNTDALVTWAEDALHRPDAHEVLFCVGRSLGEAGQVTTARNHFQHLSRTTHRHLGPHHLDTLTTRGNLAHWTGRAGDRASAVDALAALATDMVRVLGADHPDTLTTRNNLAHWQGEARDAAGAVDALAALATDMVRVLGADHPDTLTTRNNLASWRGESGDAAGAVDAFSALLADRRRVLGPDHPDTLTTRGNLAYWTGRAGDRASAVDALTALLADRRRVLGPDHPDTLTTRSNLAYWTGRAGDRASAVDALTALVTDMVRVLGADHPDTLTTRGNLAYWTGQAGDRASAVDAFSALLADRRRVLGPDHPDTLTTRGNLAYWTGRAGDRASAVDALTALLADRRRVLGPDHPDTLTTRQYRALWQARPEGGGSTTRP